MSHCGWPQLHVSTSIPPSSASRQDRLQYSSVSISAVSVQLHRSWAHSILCSIPDVYPYGLFSTAPPVICAEALGAAGQPAPGAFHVHEPVVFVPVHDRAAVVSTVNVNVLSVTPPIPGASMTWPDGVVPPPADATNQLTDQIPEGRPVTVGAGDGDADADGLADGEADDEGEVEGVAVAGEPSSPRKSARSMFRQKEFGSPLQDAPTVTNSCCGVNGSGGEGCLSVPPPTPGLLTN